MTILITGADGYIGWPTSLRIACVTEERTILVDNFGRRRWTEEVGGISAVPIVSMKDRINAAHDVHDTQNLSFIEGDLTDRDFVDELFQIHEPDTVVHLAAQPSAPYSQISGRLADYTQENNLRSTRNLLWGLHENDLNDAHFIETTTTGVYGTPAFPIPEGGAVMEHKGERDEVPFPAMAGSWYHLTKSHDAANMRLAHEQFDIPISDVRTSITYGIKTEEVRGNDRLNTRFDFDYYFGTVVHRFCAQAVAGYPVTVYGKGEQRKPFASLEDTVEGLTQLAAKDADDRESGHTVYNQTTRAISIIEIADTIADVSAEFGLDVEVEHVENPRDEDETHRMEIENDRYMGLIGDQRQTFKNAIREILGTLVDRKSTIKAYEDQFLPSVLKDRKN